MQEILVQFLGQQDPLGRLPTPVFLGFPWNTAGKFWPGEFNELYSPWSRKESDMAMQLSLSFTFGLEEKKVNGWGVCVCERERENILMYAFNKSQFSIIYASSGHQVYRKNKA